MTFKKFSHTHWYTTLHEWETKYAPMPEAQRPLVLSIDDRRGVIKIRTKTAEEIEAIIKRAGP